MAIPVGSPLDMMGNELRNFKLQQLGSPPTPASKGMCYFDTTAGRPYYHNGTEWIGMDGFDAEMTGEDIVAAINGQSDTIDLENIDVSTFTTLKNGLVPKASAQGDGDKYLKGDGTWSTPNDVFSNAKDGLVPKASTSGDTGKYLKGDGTWATPPDTQTTIVDDLTSTSTTSALSANQGKVLDGKITTAQSNAESSANSYTDSAIAALIGAAPEALDTLGELAAALGENENFSETVLTDLGKKTEKFTKVFGDGIETSFTADHGFNSRAVTVQVFQNASPWAQILCDVELTTVNRVTLRFAKPPTTDQYTVVIVG